MSRRKVARDKRPEINWLAIDYGYGYQLNTEDPETLEIPTMTWREYIEQQYDIDNLTKAELKDLLEDEFGITVDMIDEEYEYDDEIFWDSNPTTGEIFYFLHGLDISKNISDKLEWCEGACPGSNYIGVTVPDLETLEDLGEDLEKLGYDVKIGIKDEA